ncbi:MAG: hypothetical protein HZB56_15780 [Deltaproteobacteria bacterium]|nr:hypothetical protein [Deltaproteobacteria bacterium]
MPIRSVASDRAPRAIGPYSQAQLVEHPGLAILCCAGQIALDPATGEMVAGDIRAQTERVMQNVEGVLEAGGMTFANVVKTTVFLVDLSEFAAMNEVYGQRFQGAFPARSTVQVAALPRGARVEVEVMAVRETAVPGELQVAARKAPSRRPRKARRPLRLVRGKPRGKRS